MTEETKHDWFVYIDSGDDHCIPWGNHFENLTRAEAVKEANEMIYSALGDEPECALNGLWLEYDDCPEEVEDNFNGGYYDKTCCLFRVDGLTHSPVLPVLHRITKEYEEAKKVEEEKKRKAKEAREKNTRKREIADLKRLQDKYPEISNS